MTLPFLSDLPKIDPEKGPNLMAGAASPLWLMFGGAAMAGATWWWWSARWREAANVEALLAPTPLLAPDTFAKPVIDPVIEAPILTLAEAEVPEPVALDATGTIETVADAASDTLETAKAVGAEAPIPVEVVPEPVIEAAKAAADDLTLLVGIGPKLAASLGQLGVTRFAEIAAWGPKDLADFDVKLSLRGRAERDAWVAQAKRFANL